MPSITDLTVKKNDGTTDIVYTGIQPSSGDATPAVWRCGTIGTAQAHRPELRVSAREAMKGLKRVVRGTYKYPQIATNSTTGVTSIIDLVSADVTFTFHKSIAQTDINEAAAQFTNLLVTSLMRSILQTGYSAS